MDGVPVEELDAVGVLEAVECRQATQVEMERRTFVAAAHFADLHHGDTRVGHRRVLAGTERSRRPGGAGTPVVRGVRRRRAGGPDR